MSWLWLPMVFSISKLSKLWLGEEAAPPAGADPLTAGGGKSLGRGPTLPWRRLATLEDAISGRWLTKPDKKKSKIPAFQNPRVKESHGNCTGTGSELRRFPLALHFFFSKSKLGVGALLLLLLRLLQHGDAGDAAARVCFVSGVVGDYSTPGTRRSVRVSSRWPSGYWLLPHHRAPLQLHGPPSGNRSGNCLSAPSTLRHQRNSCGLPDMGKFKLFVFFM